MTSRTIPYLSSSLLALLLTACASQPTRAVHPSSTLMCETVPVQDGGATAPPTQADGTTAPATATGESRGILGTGIDAGRGLLSLPAKSVRVFGGDELPDLSPGTQELGVSGNLNFAGKTAYNFDLSYGYFFKDGWQVGLTANAFGREDFNLGAGLFTEYNFLFDQSKWVPYVGGAVKWARVSSGSRSTSSAAYGGELGVKYFIRSGVSLFTAVNFEWSPNDVFGIGNDIKDSSQNVNFGIRFYL